MKSLLSYFYQAQSLTGLLNPVQLDNLLAHAARDGQTQTVTALLGAGANIHADEDASLRLAAWWGRPETVKTLLKAGADVHARQDEALKWAVDGESPGGDDQHKQTQKILRDWVAAHPRPAP